MPLVLFWSCSSVRDPSADTAPRPDALRAVARDAAHGPGVDLLFSAGRRLQTKPCDCELSGWGGIHREMNLMRAIAAASPGRRQLALGSGPTFSEPGSRPDRDRAKALVTGLNQLGLAALSISLADTGIGVPALKELEKQAAFPFLSANLVSAKDGRALFKDSIELDIDGLSLVIVGIASVERFPGADRNTRALPIVPALRAALSRLPEKPRLVVALAAGLASKERVGLIASGLAHVVAGSGETRDEFNLAQIAPNRLLVTPPDRGRAVAWLALDAPRTPGEFSAGLSVFFNPSIWASLWRQRQHAEEKLTSSGKLERSTRRDLEREIEGIDSVLASRYAGPKQNYRFETIALDAKLAAPENVLSGLGGGR